MLSYEEQPKNSTQMVDAYEKDLDVWGNSETGIFHQVVPSLMRKLEELAPYTMDGVVKWVDLGCGPGYFLQAAIAAQGTDCVVSPFGCDISSRAVDHCADLWNTQNEYYRFFTADLDMLDDRIHRTVLEMLVRGAKVVSLIDVLYYLKDYRKTFDAVWSLLDPGTVVVISDVNIRHHRRVYPMKFQDCQHVVSFADHTVPVVKPSADSTSRFMKYAVYRKTESVIP